jgi:hypothetical protein
MTKVTILWRQKALKVENDIIFKKRDQGVICG